MTERGPERRVWQRRAGGWLVDDWKGALKWLSVQIPLVMLVVGGLYETGALPFLRDYLSAEALRWVMLAGFLCSIFGRLKNQR